MAENTFNNHCYISRNFYFCKKIAQKNEYIERVNEVCLNSVSFVNSMFCAAHP